MDKTKFQSLGPKAFSMLELPMPSRLEGTGGQRMVSSNTIIVSLSYASHTETHNLSILFYVCPTLLLLTTGANHGLSCSPRADHLLSSYRPRSPTSGCPGEPKLKLYSDVNGQLKGDGLCCYLKASGHYLELHTVHHLTHTLM